MHLYAYIRDACYILVYDSSLVTEYNGYTYNYIDYDAYICVYALCRLYPGYESSIKTIYDGYI